MFNATMSQFGAPSNWQHHRFRKDETIYFEGDVARTWFVVESGVARTCRFHADGHRQLTGFHYEGDVFGLDEDVRLESAEAVTDLTCWTIMRGTLGGCGDNLAGFEQQTVLKRALLNAQRSILLFGRRTAHERIAAFILMLERRQDAGDAIEIAMCRNDIADYLGLTIHTVSRTISQLCQEELILLDGPHHCRILDRPGLERLAGECTQTRLGNAAFMEEYSLG